MTTNSNFNGRALLHGALSTSMMAAFSHHVQGVKFGPGQKIGIAITLVIGILDAFFPNQAPVDTDPVATKKDVEDALNNLAQGAIDAEWWANIQLIQSNILAQTTGFYNVWDDLSNNVKVTPNGILQVSSTNLQLEDFIREKYKYLNAYDPTQLLTVLRQARYALESTSLNDQSLTSLQIAQHQTLTLGLYATIGSLTVAYLNAGILWAWARESQMAWEYQSYQAELADWNNKGQPPLPQSLEDRYKEVNANSGFQPLTWNDFVATPGSQVKLLIDEIKDMLNFCVGVPGQEGLYTGRWKDLTDIDTKVASYDVPLPPTGTITKADMIQAVTQGAARSGQWQTLATQNARLAAVSEEDLVSFSRILETWKAISASVRFKVYTVKQPWEYLDDIAKAFYGDPNFDVPLFDANSDTLDYSKVYPPPPPHKGPVGPFGDDQDDAPRGGRLYGGTLIKLFEVDALPYNLNPLQLTKGI